MTAIEESESLHARVRRFGRGEPAAGDFDDLALEIARFQARWSPGFRRLVEARGSALDSVGAIPAVPCDAFRLSRVAVHPPELDEVRFSTSGTTSSAPGVHAMRTTQTYRELALLFGARALTSAWPGRRVVVAIAPRSTRSSSLAFMLDQMIERFDGRDSQTRWLLDAAGVDIAALRRFGELARSRDEPLLVLATAFALVALLDTLGESVIAVPPRTVVMQTGGFKGRTREIAPQQLRSGVARAFGIPESHVIGEYGMTELTSQLYEGTLPGGELRSEPGVYVEPPWLRVTAVDPASLEPVADGEIGLARFVDLGNVDSAVAIVAQDLVRRRRTGVELLGRRAGAPPRGCSLAIEELLGQNSHSRS